MQPFSTRPQSFVNVKTWNLEVVASKKSKCLKDQTFKHQADFARDVWEKNKHFPSPSPEKNSGKKIKHMNHMNIWFVFIKYPNE